LATDDKGFSSWDGFTGMEIYQIESTIWSTH
jgi:hypothetical protein